jgi:hypothetical protein
MIVIRNLSGTHTNEMFGLPHEDPELPNAPIDPSDIVK